MFQSLFPELSFSLIFVCEEFSGIQRHQMGNEGFWLFYGLINSKSDFDEV
jgi:hypothetical protein